MEYLFRGMDTFNNWYYGFYQRVNGDIFIGKPGIMHIIKDEEDRWSEVIPETVGLWTGLTDKNGVKVFKGDLYRDKYDVVYEIIFKDGAFTGYNKKGIEEDEMFVDIFSLIANIEDYDVELIGNIHQEERDGKEN